MKKTLTIEIDLAAENLELHLNKKGAEFLQDILSKLIHNNKDCDHHFMSPDWGGDELTSDKQNLSDDVKLIHQLKIIYSSK